MQDPNIQYADLKNKIVSSIQSIFPVEGKKNIISIKDMSVTDVSDDNYKEQMDLKAKGGTLSSPITATVVLTDKNTKEVIDQAKMKVGMVPRVTRRGSYIIDGNEYQIPYQLLLRPGIFHRVKENGELEAFVNVKGFQAKILFDPEKAIFFLSYGTNNIQLLPLLFALGVTETQFIKAWGKDTYELMKKNSKSDPQTELAKLNKASNGRATTDSLAATLWLKSWKLDDRVTGKTLQGQTDLSPETLLASSAKLLKINRKEETQDERDSLEFKSIHSVDDFIKNRFVQNATKIKAKIKTNLDIRENVRQIVSSNLLSDPVHSFFVESSLSNTTEQINPLHMMGETNKIIITGEGGIENDHAITDQARMAHPSQLGFIDPVHTPEKLVGVAQHLSVFSHKEGNDLYTYLFNLKTKKLEKIRVDQVSNSIVSFADQFDKDRKPKTKQVSASVHGKFGMVDADKVEYILYSDKTMFDYATNLAPFLQSNSGNRAAFAGKQLEQSLILKHREAPLVQTEMDKGLSFEKNLGQSFAVKSEVDGTVTKVDDDFITIGDKKYSIYNHFPLRSKQYLHHTALVKAGDKVKKGQIIADLNSNKDGHLALGTNLNTAFMSYKGYTFEDGIAVTESAAKQLTSEHMYKEEIDIDANSILDKKRFQNIYPTKFNAAQMAKLDDQGVVKEGIFVEDGDPLVAHLHKEDYSKEDVLLAAFRKSSIKPFKDRSLLWLEGEKGKVLRVIKKNKTIEIQVLTEEVAKVGNKLSGRHGNKGIITCHDEKTQLLTESGWKFIKDVTLSEKIVTLNKTTKEVEFHNPTSLINQPYTGKMYLFEGRRLNLCTTPEHNHFVSNPKKNEFGFKTAEECFGHQLKHCKFGLYDNKDLDYIRIPGSKKNNISDKIHSSSLIELLFKADDFLEFFGYYITEGCISGKHHIHIGQTKSVNPEIYQKIVNVCNRLGFNTCEYETVITISCRQLNEYLSQFGLATDKFIPREFMSASKRQLTILYNAIQDGDGGKYFRLKDNHTREELFTSSKKLADDYQELIFKIGYSANIKPQVRDRKNIEYVVRMTKNEFAYTLQDERYPSTEKWIDYSGNVYCVDVPNHTIYIRRNGICVWSGNCIIPDNEALHTEDGKRIDIYMDPHGIPGRINPSQNLELAASKIAEHTKKPFVVDNFSGRNYLHEIDDYMIKHNIKDKEVLIDPTNGNKIDAPVQTGKMFIMQLDHPVRKKFSARAQDGYSSDLTPLQGGGVGGQSIDKLTLYSMLAHGANHNLREMSTYKSEKSDDFWNAYQSGLPLPNAKVPFVFEKFRAMLAASGVNLNKQGDTLNLVPVTDKTTKEMSHGVISSPYSVKAKDLTPEKGGIFDSPTPDSWMHIELNEPMPMPMYEEAILALTGLKKVDLVAILEHKKFVKKDGTLSDEDGMSGGLAIKRLLDLIDLDAERIKLTNQAKKLEGSELDKVNRKLKYILSLKNNNLKLSDYMTTKIPVIPTKFRQIIQQKNGSLIIPDVNQLYADIIKVNNQLGNISHLPDSEKANLRKDLYQGMKALVGTGDALTKKGSRDWKGFIKQIAGSSPKFGFYQHKVISKRQDFTGRSTIIPEPSYGLDEVGIPYEMAWKIYRPHVIKSLVRLGYKPLDARNAVEKQTDIAKRALENEVKERPSIINRSPSLHKFSIMSFIPKLIEGKAIKLNPLVVGGFNADFDGDQQIGLVFSLIPSTISQTLGAKMTSRYRELIPVNLKDTHELILLNLRDFPHNKVIGIKDHIEFYEAHENCFVMSYDEVNRKVLWTKVSGWSKHHDREVEIVNLHNGDQIITDNDPRAVYGCKPGSLVMERFNPENAAKEQVLVPINVRLTDVNSEIINSIKLDKKYLEPSKNDAFQLKKEIKLTREFGYLLGVLIGDGWISGETLKSGDFSARQINLSGLDEDIFKEFKNSLKSIFENEIPKETYHEFKKEDNESRFGDSNRITFSSMRASKFLLDLIGKGAKNKKLPYFFLNAPKEFRLGLLGGLMDTDGSVSISNGKSKPQLMSNYTTISVNLAYEVKLLMKSLGIKGTISSFNSKLKNTRAFIITLSSVDLLKWNYEGMNCDRKKIRDIEVNESACCGNDIVPVSMEVIESVKKFASKINNSMNAILSKARKEGSISRNAALKIIKDPLFNNDEWKKIVENTDVTWTYVDSYEKTEIKETGYDLTVPGYETFINANGVILSNTMSVHVPVSEDARKEAFDMLPSNNLFNPQSNSLEHKPSRDQVSGLYMLTLPPKTLVPKKAYSNIGELKSDYKALKVSVIDVVTVNKMVNTVGRFLVNDSLPVKYQSKDIVLDKNGLSNLLLKIAHEDPKEYGPIISKLKDLGNAASYSTGLSFGIKDLRLANSSVIKAEFLKMEKALIAAKDPVKWVQNFAANDMKSSIILKEVHDDLKKKDSGLYHLLQSSLGSKKNQVEQMLAGPMFVTDHKGDPVPVLIKNSYVDGLTAAEYWTTMAGVRKGMMDRALETMDTGAFSKEVINSGLYGKITEYNCGTDEGILVSLKDKPVHYLDRYAAKGNVGIKAQTLITKDVLKNYKGESIRVRSPLTCKARHQPCAMCFGLKENGKLPSIGDAVGVISAQSLSEPSVQLGMRTFHSGGAVGAQSISGFDRAKQLVELPKVVPDKAALAESSGTVSKVSEAPQGGHYISVGGNVHYSLMKPTVKEGDKVHRGDTLSLGNVKPQELAELKGTLDAKQYIVNEVVKLYEDAGRTIRRPLVETAIGQIIRYAQITDPGESDTTVGDYLPVNEIEFRNKSLKKKIIYKEIVKGIGLAPFKSEDFLARLNFERIPEVIQRGAAMGWKSEIHGTHPVPGYAYGAEYGQKPTPGAKSPEKQIALPILFKKK